MNESFNIKPFSVHLDFAACILQALIGDSSDHLLICPVLLHESEKAIPVLLEYFCNQVLSIFVENKFLPSPMSYCKYSGKKTFTKSVCYFHQPHLHEDIIMNAKNALQGH